MRQKSLQDKSPCFLGGGVGGLTGAFAALHVRLQLPALVAGALDTRFLLFTLLATLEMFGAKALDVAGLVVSSQLHAQRTRTHEAFPGNNAAVVTTTPIAQRTQVCRQEIKWKGWSLSRKVFWMLNCKWNHNITLNRCCAFWVQSFSRIFSPQSFSSEPSGQSSVPSHSFSGGRQMESLVAHTWWDNLHTNASQLSSSELSSQSLSPSHTQALLMQRAEKHHKNTHF